MLAAISEREAGFRSLSDQWADTTTPHGRLMLTVLGGLAEFERSLILSRTGEGRTRATTVQDAELTLTDLLSVKKLAEEEGGIASPNALRSRSA